MKTVLTYGVFDLYHQGHENLLRRAKALGDRLIVGVTTDQFAYQRGKLCTVESAEQRMANVRACPYVDEVILEDHYGQKAEDILRFHADILAMGDDWLGKFDPLQELCEVVYLPRTPNISSTALRNSRFPFLRVGMIGAGRIARRFLREAGVVHDVRVAGVYHPNPDASESLRSLLEEHTSLYKVRTLDKLFDQSDAVYIASPHETHYAYAKAALEAGRHVLCEKPLCFSRAEAEELYTLAESRGLVLMEAVKTAYCPGFRLLCAIARSGFIGEIVDVQSCFTRLTPPGCREWTDRRYGGSFTELGSYVLLPIVKLLGTDELSVSFQSACRSDGLDTFTRVLVRSPKRTAEGTCALGAKAEGELIVSGTAGYIWAEAPWWKTKYFEVRTEDPTVKKRFTADFEADGLRYEIADFLYRIQEYPGREDRLTPAESVCMAGIMEQFLRQREER